MDCRAPSLSPFGPPSRGVGNPRVSPVQPRPTPRVAQAPAALRPSGSYGLHSRQVQQRHGPQQQRQQQRRRQQQALPQRKRRVQQNQQARQQQRRRLAQLQQRQDEVEEICRTLLTQLASMRENVDLLPDMQEHVDLLPDMQQTLNELKAEVAKQLSSLDALRQHVDDAHTYQWELLARLLLRMGCIPVLREFHPKGP